MPVPGLIELRCGWWLMVGARRRRRHDGDGPTGEPLVCIVEHFDPNGAVPMAARLLAPGEHIAGVRTIDLTEDEAAELVEALQAAIEVLRAERHGREPAHD
jgi:hypothetical protein